MTPRPCTRAAAPAPSGDRLVRVQVFWEGVGFAVVLAGGRSVVDVVALLACDPGQKPSSFLREMSPNQARRTFTMTTFAAAFLALVALGVREPRRLLDRHNNPSQHSDSREKLKQAAAALSRSSTTEQGDVVDEDRSQ